jgi:hypothetical protein
VGATGKSMERRAGIAVGATFAAIVVGVWRARLRRCAAGRAATREDGDGGREDCDEDGEGSDSAREKVTKISAQTPATAANAGSGSASSSGGRASNFTTSLQDAVASAPSYLSLQGLSRYWLIAQLSSSAGEGYSVSDATVAVGRLDVTWDAEAVKSAKAYLKLSSFSCQGLIQQLSSSAGEQYTLPKQPTARSRSVFVDGSAASAPYRSSASGHGRVPEHGPALISHAGRM